MIQERNARTGFFERSEFDAVRAHLPDDLRAVFEVANDTGWRVKSEILTRLWIHVDLRSGWLRLEPGETKNGEGLSKSGRKNMVGRDGIEPPTPGFSVLFPGSCKCA